MYERFICLSNKSTLGISVVKNTAIAGLELRLKIKIYIYNFVQFKVNKHNYFIKEQCEFFYYSATDDLIKHIFMIVVLLTVSPFFSYYYRISLIWTIIVNINTNHLFGLFRYPYYLLFKILAREEVIAQFKLKIHNFWVKNNTTTITEKQIWWLSQWKCTFVKEYSNNYRRKPWEMGIYTFW